ncbi:MAG: helix-turn-helix domain-containing protein [Acidobacteria bacterium]|nr:helix-turn-helix domain-containing protein [Acidobacteriota bacterium]
MPDLSHILADPGALDALAVEELAALRGELMRLDALILARLTAGNGKAVPAPARLLDAKEAAVRLGVSTDWLYRRSGRLPFMVKVGGRTMFSEQGIVVYIQRRMGR